MNAFIPLHTFLDHLLPLTEDQKTRFSRLFTVTTLTKGEHLLRTGDSFSYLYFSSNFLAHLTAKPNAAIVNVSSGLGLVPKKSAPVYGATKAAVHLFTKGLRYQLEATRVKVFEIIPPLASTEMTERRGKGKISSEQLALEFVRGFELLIDPPTHSAMKISSHSRSKSCCFESASLFV